MKDFYILRTYHSGEDLDNDCVTVSLRVTGAKNKWITLVDDNGSPKFYLSDEEIIALYRKGDIKTWLESIEKYLITEFEGLKLGEYNDVFFSMYNDFVSIYTDGENPAVKLIRYMIDLIFAKDSKEITDLMHLPMGRSIDEVDVPISYIEDNYLIENGEKHI
jgi:hypothetical protein